MFLLFWEMEGKYNLGSRAMLCSPHVDPSQPGSASNERPRLINEPLVELHVKSLSMVVVRKLY